MSALLLAACAVHPLPEDVTPLNTVAIVAKIRCEAKDRIAKKAVLFLSQFPETRAIAARLDHNDTAFKDIRKYPMSPLVRAALDKYAHTAIAYDFTFDMTEDNDVTTQLDFIRAFTGGIFGAGLQAGDDHMRQTTRNFRISDTFEGLVTGDLTCRPGDFTSSRYDYPITGRIGLGEVIDTFVDLNEFENLSGKDKVPVLADTFHFQTTLSGSLSPHVTLSPVTRGLTDASLSATGMRRDIHEVIVAMSLPPREKPSVRPRAGVLGTNFTLTSASGKSDAEVRAIEEIYNQINRRILQNIPQRSN